MQNTLVLDLLRYPYFSDVIPAIIAGYRDWSNPFCEVQLVDKDKIKG
jgi:hypothetical protein